VAFDYPEPRPTIIAPEGGTSFDVEIAGSCGGQLAPGSALLHYDAGEGFQAMALEELGGDLFRAVFPAVECGTAVEYYLSAEDTGGGTAVDPPGAPATTYHALSADEFEATFTDNFEFNQGWVATNLGATAGFWQRGVPVNDPNWSYDPATDGDGSGQCWLTQNELGNTDVDDGAVRLTSPDLDLSTGNIIISYEYYLRLTEPGTDHMLVEISPDSGAGPWTTIADHTDDGGGSWHHHEITQAQIEAQGVVLTADMKVRFTTNDAAPQSINESGLDGFTISQVVCEGNPADVNGDGVVDVDDMVALILAWGPCPGCPADVNGDGVVDVDDLVEVILNWN
jgi:hypothetical protein